VPASELHRVALQEPDLVLGEDDRIALSVLLEADEPLVAGLEGVAQPHPTHAAGTDVCSPEAKFIRNALRSMRGKFERVVEDHLALDLGGDAIGMRISRTAALLDEGGNAADLERTTDLVERIAMIAHDLAGSGDVPELFGQLQQGQLPLGTLRERSHLGTPDSWWFGDYQSIPETRVAALPAPALRYGAVSAATVGKIRNYFSLAIRYRK
jgi:hypothetical protein